MPTRDQVLQVPFVGGIDENTDPDQLQPPGMAALTNCVVRKPGRIEKREGFSFIAKTGSTTDPATAFGGTNAFLPDKHEALGTNSGADGSRLLLAADNTLFEYVGSDATHGYREVNRLPSCIGTLHPVDATGGEIIEVESMVSDDGLYRCTAWVLGVRNGQDMTSDTAVGSQPLSTHGLYVAVQRVSDGAFVTKTTRILTPGGGNTAQIVDLRMALVLDSAGVRRNWVVAFRSLYSEIDAFVVRTNDGAILPTRLLLAFVGRTYHRAFDITNIVGENRLLFAYCDADILIGNADANLKILSYDETLGTFATVSTYTGVLAAAGVGGVAGAYNWIGFATRGVVLETEPSGLSFSMAIRAVFESSGAPTVLDGKLAVVRITTTASTVTYNSWAWVHRIAFQTAENFVTSFGDKRVNAKTASVSPSTNFLKNPSVTAKLTNPIVVTGQFYDTSTQTYVFDPDHSVQVDGFTNWYSTFWPYEGEQDGVVAAGTVSGQLFAPSTPTSVNAFPHNFHSYSATTKQATLMAPVPFGTPLVQDQVQINKQQVTRLVPGVGAAIASTAVWNELVYCDVRKAGVVWCKAIIIFGPAGQYLSVAIYNGNPGNPILGIPGAYSADDIVVTSPAVLAGTYALALNELVMRDDLNTALAYLVQSIGADLAGDKVKAPQTNFDTLVAPEECVHRWDVKTVGASTFVALSSVSAGTIGTPSAQLPYGYASPFAQNNYFEVYKWAHSVTSKSLTEYDGTGSSTLSAALGGPWRLMSSLALMAGGSRLACIVTPGGDSGQRSAILLSFDPSAAPAEIVTGKPPSGGATIIPTAEDVKYNGNSGFFVESFNMPRVAAVTLNVPRLTASAASSVLSVGAVRDGSVSGSNEVFVLQYEFNSHKWRKMHQWSDYTVINGGLVSTFDGSTCNEVSMLLWPQQDMVSLAYPRDLPALDIRTYWSDDYFANKPFLKDVTRPFFTYECGMKPFADGNGWAIVMTKWGGRADQSYEAAEAGAPRVTATPRTAALSSYWAQNVGQVRDVHFYGRYQSGYSTGYQYSGGTTPSSVEEGGAVFWGPRSSSGATTPNDDKSAYSSVVANGDFLIAWTYECVDGTGRVVRSAPSAAIKYTIVSVVGGGSKRYKDVKSVNEYRHGFFAPRLELTNRQNTAAKDPRRVVVQPYSSAEPFASVLYKMPFTNFYAGYQDAFVVPRNTTRGVVPYTSQPLTGVGNGPYGFVTSTLTCFDGPLGEYNGILSQPFLYTTGGVLDNVAPPSAKAMCVHQNRLILGGADDPTVVWFSKELSPTDAPGFNDALTIQIEDGGPVTGLASLESVLVIFKKEMTFIVPGDMPDDTGGGVNRGYVSNTLGTPVKMPHGIGCIDHRSVVETPIGVFFQSSRTIELLTRDMSITPVGLKLDDLLYTYPNITAAFHNAKDTEVWFAVRPNEASAPIFLVYNYLSDVWSKHEVGVQPNLYTLPATIMDGNVYFASRWIDPLGGQPVQSIVYKQTENKFFDVKPEGREYVKMSWTTAPLALNNVQGYQRLKRVRVQGSPIPTKSTGAAQTRDPHGASFTLQTDFSTTAPNNGLQLASWDEGEVTEVYTAQNREVFEVHVREQKGERLVLSYQETDPADLNALVHGYGTAFSNLSFVVGLKAGLDKRITSGAKH